MTVFAVYAPSGAVPGSLAEAEEIKFVEDKFTRGVIAFGPFWLALTGRWLGALFYVIIFAAAAGLLAMLNLWPASAGLLYFALNFFMAHEEPSLHGLALELVGWRPLGVIEAQTRDDAELRFFKLREDPRSQADVSTTAASKDNTAMQSLSAHAALKSAIGAEHKVIARAPLMRQRWRHGGDKT